MSTFTDALAVEITDRKKRGRVVARLLRGFSYWDRGGNVYTVPAGFETDFASTPRWLWPIAPPLGRYAKAAVLHDYLYVFQSTDRRTADRLLREGSALLGVPAHVRWLLWAAVRAFGSTGWRRDRAI